MSFTAASGTKIKCHSYRYVIDLSEELTDDEVLTLAERVGTFNFLNSLEEDIYNK